MGETFLCRLPFSSSQIIESEEERSENRSWVEGPPQKISRIRVEIDTKSPLHLFSLIEKPFDVAPQLLLKEGFRSFGVKVFNPELSVKQKRSPKLAGIDEIIGILSPRDIGVKGDTPEKVTMEDKVSAQKDRRKNKSLIG